MSSKKHNVFGQKLWNILQADESFNSLIVISKITKVPRRQRLGTFSILVSLGGNVHDDR